MTPAPPEPEPCTCLAESKNISSFGMMQRGNELIVLYYNNTNFIILLQTIAYHMFLKHPLHAAFASSSFIFGLDVQSRGKVEALQLQMFCSHERIKLCLCSVYFYIQYI